MKPVIIQQLMRRNKKQRKTESQSDLEIEQYRNRTADFVFWFIVFIVVIGLLLA